MKVENGDVVKVDYTGKFENGEVFDTTKEDIAKEHRIYSGEREYEPLEVKVGIDQVIDGFDKALVGMRQGEEKEAEIFPEEAYGERKMGLIRTIPLQVFTENKITPKPGMQIGTDDGVATITKVEDENVEVDFNHPLAGKKLIFEIRVEKIRKAK